MELIFKISSRMSSLLEQQFRAKWSVWAALGAGCLVGVSGMVLIQRLQVSRTIGYTSPSDCSAGNLPEKRASLLYILSKTFHHNITIKSNSSIFIQKQMRIEQVSQPALADNGQNMSKELTNLHKTLKELQEEIRQIKTRPPLK